MTRSLTPREDRILALASELNPAIEFRIDDPDGFARTIDQLTPYWPLPTNGTRHQWALFSEGAPNLPPLLMIECPDCREQFEVRHIDGYWECSCPSCLMDAASAEDGTMPARGFGTTALEAADDWSNQ